MNTITPRAARLARQTALSTSRNVYRAPRQQLRFATTESTSQSAAATARSSIDQKAVIGGLLGGGLVFLTGYGYYHYSGAATVVSATKRTKAKFDSMTSSIQSAAPPPSEALQWLHNTALSYAVFIPGAKTYVDKAFKDIEQIQRSHGPEVEKVVERVYGELKTAAKDAPNQSVTETAQAVWEALEKGMSEIGSLAGDSMQDILQNHPQIKEKLGGNLEQFQKLAKQYGGEDVKKEVRDTMQQVKDIVASAGSGGLGLEAINKVKKLIQDKGDKLKSMGNKAWEEGYAKTKPYLEKKPEVKKFVEQNLETFKSSGNATEALSKISDALYSGKTDDLKKYVEDAKNKAKDMSSSGGNGGGDLMHQGAQYAKSFFPASGMGAEVLPKAQELMKVAESKGEEAEKILKQTWEEVVQVLRNKQGEVERLAESVKKEGEKQVKK